eukprot:427765-Amphidinium_carterae.2
MQPSWDSTTKQFTRQHYKWLEDINRYESENGQKGSITDHVKIANRQSFQKTNYTTLDAEGQEYGDICRAPTVIQRTSKGHLELTTRTRRTMSTHMIAFNKWMKGKGKVHWYEGKNKGKNKGGKKGDNNYNNYNSKGSGKDKESN